MGQKINPVSLRLHYTNRHFDSCWYSNYFYKNLITKDIFLQQYLNNFLKLLKLPVGRYSIQHLQKKTQVYNFLCYSKSTREWRLKLFGLTKKSSFLKKNRFFFKNKTNRKFRNFSKNKFRRHTKLSPFFTTLNQLAVHKIQKKITSFQNLKLWSALNKPTQRIKTSSIQRATNLQSFHLINYKQLENTNSLQKINQTATTKQRIRENTSQLISKKQADNSNLLFLQNLFVYKTLKSTLNVKNKITESKPFKVHTDGNKYVTKSGTQSGPKPSLFNRECPLNWVTDLSTGVKPAFHTLDFKYKNYLESSLSSLYKLELDLIPFKVKNDWQYASYLADEIAYFLEKRIPFRRLKGKLLRELSKIPTIRGARIICSGRVGGKSKKAQRAKIECLKYGQTSLQVFSSRIDFSVKTAFTSFGSVGVKVWICYS